MQFVPSPTDWVFGVLTVVFLLAAVGTLPAAGELAAAARRAGLAAPAGARAARAPPGLRRRAAAAWSRAWALGGLYASLGPSLVADVFGIDNHLVGGLLILALNGTGILGSLALRTSPPGAGAARRARSSSPSAWSAPLAALFATSAALLFAAAVVTGFGFGAAFLGAVATITAGVAPGHRAGLLASIFVVGYLAFSVPAIAAGIAVGAIGLTRTTEVYGAAVVVLALLGRGRPAARAAGRSPPRPPTRGRGARGRSPPDGQLAGYGVALSARARCAAFSARVAVVEATASGVSSRSR